MMIFLIQTESTPKHEERITDNNNNKLLKNKLKTESLKSNWITYTVESH